MSIFNFLPKKKLNRRQAAQTSEAHSKATTTAAKAETTTGAAALPSFQNDHSQTLTAFPEQTSTPASSSSASSAKPSSSSVSSTSAVSSSSSSSSSNGFSSIASTSATSATNSPSASAAASTDGNNGGLSGSAIGAIVAIVIIVAGGLIAFLLIRRRQKKNAAESRLARFSMGPTYNATTDTNGFTAPMTNYQGAYNNYNASSNPVPAPAPPFSFMEQQQQQQQKLQPAPPPVPPPTLGVNTVAAGTAPIVPEPLSATVVATPTTDPSQDLWQQQPIGTYTIVAAYTPTLNDEIDVQPGDQVQIFVEYDDGWCLGANITRGNVRGVFPKHCIVPPTPEMSQQPMPSNNPTAMISNAAPAPAAAPAASNNLAVADQNKRVSSLYGPPPQLQ